jgi:uncharacterized protein YbdZ (MbtH family)
MDEQLEHESYQVVRNDEEQHSIWPEQRPLPDGWHQVGFAGGKDACLAHIEQVWTDMRPLSLRRAMAAAPALPAGEPADDGPDLLTRLSTDEHPVQVVLRPRADPARLRDAIDARYVHLRFSGTNGGTELGVRLTPETDASAADFEAGTGTVTLVGTLTLDFRAATCRALVDVGTLAGRGSLRET